MNTHKPSARFLTKGIFALLVGSLQADDFSVHVGPTGSGPTNPFGTVDLQSGAFMLIGSMESGREQRLFSLVGRDANAETDGERDVVAPGQGHSGRHSGRHNSARRTCR